MVSHRTNGHPRTQAANIKAILSMNWWYKIFTSCIPYRIFHFASAVKSPSSPASDHITADGGHVSQLARRGGLLLRYGGQPCPLSPNLKVTGPASLAFSGPPHMRPCIFWPRPTKFGMATCWVWRVRTGSKHDLCRKGVGGQQPQIFGTSLMRPHSMTHDNPVLPGDETR